MGSNGGSAEVKWEEDGRIRLRLSRKEALAQDHPLLVLRRAAVALLDALDASGMDVAGFRGQEREPDLLPRLLHFAQAHHLDETQAEASEEAAPSAGTEKAEMAELRRALVAAKGEREALEAALFAPPAPSDSDLPGQARRLAKAKLALAAALRQAELEAAQLRARAEVSTITLPSLCRFKLGALLMQVCRARLGRLTEARAVVAAERAGVEAALGTEPTQAEAQLERVRAGWKRALARLSDDKREARARLKLLKVFHLWHPPSHWWPHSSERPNVQGILVGSGRPLVEAALGQAEADEEQTAWLKSLLH